MDRLGDDPVRRQEQEPPDLVGDHSALDRGAGDDRGAVQECGEPVLHAGPPRQSQQRPEPLVGTAEPGHEPEARAPHRDRRRRHEGDDTQGATESQEDLLGRGQVEARRRSGEHAEGDQERHHHHGVADGRHGGHHEAAACVQHRGGDGAQPVEHDLRDEEPQQERGQLPLLAGDRRVGDRDGQQVGQPGGSQHADHAHGAQDHQCDAEQLACQVLGARLVPTVQVSDEGRHQHCGQCPRRQQLEQQVRHRVGALERVAQVGGAEHGGDDQDPATTHHTGHGRRGAHPGR